MLPQQNYNLCLMTDSYKCSHWLQFPSNTKTLFYYGESRSKDKNILFFGLQYIIKEFLMQVPTKNQIEEAEKFWNAHGFEGIFNKEGWLEISKLGYLPIEIRAAKEGKVYPSRNVLFAIHNTDPEFYWLPGWLETIIMQVWYPITVATKSWEIKQIIKKYLEETHDSLEGLPFKLHDFGYRGVSSYMSAMVGGMAHLVNFMGTDTIAGIEGIWRWYDPKNTKEVFGFSIPAAEHSTVTSWTKEYEIDAYRNMLKHFAKPGKIVAIVSDSYDIYHAVEKIWGEYLKQEVIASEAIIVVRPDSGDPVEVPIWCVEKLAEKFGYTTNQKGYKVLNHVRVIQGDGIDKNDVQNILEGLKRKGFSAENIAFGMGAGLLQKLNRDTYKFAFKCSARQDTNGNWHDIYKAPITDPGKKSKAGLLSFIKDGNVYKTINVTSLNYIPENSELEVVFHNGHLLKEYNFSEIKKNSGE